MRTAAAGRAPRVPRRRAPRPWRRGWRVRSSRRCWARSRPHSRVLRLGPGLELRLDLLARAAVAPLAVAERLDRDVERRSVEIRPQQVGEIELGISELPEQEIGDALFSAGADEQVGLGC